MTLVPSERTRAEDGLQFPFRNLAANLIRIVRGAGRPEYLGAQLAACIEAIEEHRAVTNQYPKAKVFRAFLNLNEFYFDPQEWATEKEREANVVLSMSGYPERIEAEKGAPAQKAAWPSRTSTGAGAGRSLSRHDAARIASDPHVRISRFIWGEAWNGLISAESRQLEFPPIGPLGLRSMCHPMCHGAAGAIRKAPEMLGNLRHMNGTRKPGCERRPCM